jgi:CheY-like chemotaxis protein
VQPGRAARILIIDSNPGEAPVLREAVHSLRWHAVIESLPYGMGAIESIKRRQQQGEAPDLLLIDYRLIRETGIYFLKRLQASALQPLPPFVIFTASRLSASLRRTCLAQGAARIMDKPWSFEGAIKVMAQVQQLLVERSAERPAAPGASPARIRPAREEDPRRGDPRQGAVAKG